MVDTSRWLEQNGWPPHQGARLLNDAYNASPTSVLAVLKSLAPHWPKVLAFRVKQIKRQTLVLSVKSFVLVASLYCAWLLLGILLP